MGAATPSTCAGCGARLASDNRSGSCSPCSRRVISDGTPRLRPAPDFWASEVASQAVQRRDFGLLLRAFRNSTIPPLTQADMGVILELSQGQVSRIESGRTIVNDLVKLARWSQALGAPEGSLWFSLPAEALDHEQRPGNAEDDKPIDGGRPPILPLAAGDSDEDGHLPTSVTSLPATNNPLVSDDDVDALRETIRAFRQIDNRFGGGRAREAVVAYLATDVARVLSDGRFARGCRPHFELAAAEMYQLAGWMAYDVGDAKGGRKDLRQALELATVAGDDALTAEMLAAMSHQAAFSRQPDEAIDFALAARRAAHRSGAPALQAEAAALEAQGLALSKDARGCIAALHRAERAFHAATGENTPQWLLYFDRAYLSAKFAQALRDLGRPVDAERFARDSLQMSDGYDRGRLFNTALLATILADAGQVDESVSTARDAVQMAGRVRSVRAQGYLREAGTRLLPYSSHSGARELFREMREAGVNLRQ